ncbi:DUF2975 domain-containing protein [Myroides sp. JBRI-B21084]|uniref:DUF2975 domain-containing protein n=1 Tax=Myroides sp. JBRI-B21084 TaxID=3119977 RepID=UPI0026E3CE72|nr:DUF2975 domain-containing protein [Paenimyroides cloacae]WKW47513.1 DUF2975 domain-containing protein [Paenimyroides cloacae]
MITWTNTPKELANELNQEENVAYFSTFPFFLEIITMVLFFLILLRMKKVVTQFTLKNYFTLENAKNIRLIGWLVISIFIIQDFIVEYCFPLFNSISAMEYDPNIVKLLEHTSFKLFLGIFLLGIGKAFELGLKQQQENELTI